MNWAIRTLPGAYFESPGVYRLFRVGKNELPTIYTSYNGWDSNICPDIDTVSNIAKIVSGNEVVDE
jgi:hypothetical protein